MEVAREFYSKLANCSLGFGASPSYDYMITGIVMIEDSIVNLCLQKSERMMKTAEAAIQHKLEVRKR